MGATSVWADDITITYDFQSYANTKCPSFRDEVAITTGSSVGAVYGTTQNYIANELPDFSFGGNFAFQNTDFKFRNSSSVGAAERRGLFSSGNDRYFSIVDLAVGDKVKLTFPDEDGVLFVSTNATYDNSGTPTAVSQWASVVSEREYTITSAGRLDLQQKGKSKQYMTLLKVVIVTSRTETVSEPSVAATGANGNERTVTITPGTSSIKSGVATYYTVDGSTPTTLSTRYTTPFTIDATKTVKAITVSNSSAATSSVVASQVIEAGVPLSVAAPIITFSSMTANGSFYSPQYSIANGDNSAILGSPSPTLTATFNGSAVDISSGTFTPNTSGTLVVAASADGYNPASTEFDIAHGLYACQSTPNFNEIALKDLGTTLGGTWEEFDNAARESEWSTTGGVNADLTTNGGGSYYKYKLTSGGSVNVGDWFTFTRNRGSSNLRVLAGYGLGEKGFAPSMKINNPVEGGVVEYVNGKSGSPSVAYVTMTAADEEAKAWNATGLAAAQALRYCKYYTPLPTIADGEAVKLTFINATAGTGTAYGENWKMDFYGTSGKVSNVRADWWDEVANTNTLYTYGYTYSSDGGATPNNTNVWATYMNDMTDANVDLTVSYDDGTLYVIGTMIHDQTVYYVNYAKSGLSGVLTYNLYGNNATLSNITTTAASVTTTPAHPINVAVTLGSNGYTTYANNVYPLDLTSAKAYKAAVSDNKVNFTLFEQAVPASTGMLVEGEASAIVNLPIADASTAVDGNAFMVNTSGNTFAAADNTTYYAMIKDSAPLKFGTFAPGTLAFPAAKAYLAVTSSTPAKALTAIFGDDVTGISNVNAAESAQPAKRIVNGQLVIEMNGKRYNAAGAEF